MKYRWVLLRENLFGNDPKKWPLKPLFYKSKFRGWIRYTFTWSELKEFISIGEYVKRRILHGLPVKIKVNIRIASSK